MRAGFEASAPELQKPQDERSQAFYRDLAVTLQHRAPAGLLLRNARLFDSERKTIHDGWSVLVRGDRIAAVGPDAEIAAPAGAETIDAAGATLLPGLWDMHTHQGEGDGLLQLAAGVLGARDLANDMDAVRELERQWESGETLGPRLVLAGFLDEIQHANMLVLNFLFDEVQDTRTPARFTAVAEKPPDSTSRVP